MGTMHSIKPWILAASTVMALACGDDGEATDTEASDPSTSTTTGPGSGDTEPTPGTTSAVDDSGTTTAASSSGGGVCEFERPAIVTDIDETLTLSDAEFIMQIGDGNYDPIEREGGAALIGAYADLGYHVMYLTARSEQIMVEVTNETAREATLRWLEEHGYPLGPDDTSLVLAPMFLTGDDVVAYKAGAIMEQQAAGLRFDYAYGNATTDIQGYAQAGIPLETTFIIGENAGVDGTVAVEGEGWVEHASEHLPGVPAVCVE